jgi:hypothetical protein
MNDNGRDKAPGATGADDMWFDRTLRSGNEAAPTSLRELVRDIAAGSVDPAPQAVVHNDAPGGRPRLWLWLAAAAVVVVLMGGGLWLAAGGDDDRLESADSPAMPPVETVTGVSDDSPAPTPTSAPIAIGTLPDETVSSTLVTVATTSAVATVPVTTVPVTTVPVTTVPVTTVVAADDQLVTSCFADMAGPDALRAFVITRADDTELGALDACVSSKDQFLLTSFSPACWEPCGSERVFRLDSLPVAEYQTAPPQWGVSIPVTYLVDGSQVDSAERWEAVGNPAGGYRFSLASIDVPLTTREEAGALIDEYFAAIERADWHSVAGYLGDGALESEERKDLQRLGITDYSLDGVAAGLAEWCSGGCIGTPPPAAALLPNGYTYEIVEGGEVIKVVWYEGYLSILGLPFRL